MTATDDTRLFDDAFTPPDAEAMETGRFDAPARLHDAQVDALAEHMPRAEAETLVAADEYLAAQMTAAARAEVPEPPTVYDGIVSSLQGSYVSSGAPVECASADPLASRREADWPEPPDYGHPPTRTGELLLEIDQQIAGSLAARNQALRAQLRTVTAELAAERSARQDAQLQLAAARDRIAELVLTLRALGGAIHHANQHAAKQADDGRGEEGGQSDG